MKTYHRTIVLALAALPGCFVFGQETADPTVTPGGDRVSPVFYSEPTVTAVAADADRIFAVTEKGDPSKCCPSPTNRALWELSRGGAVAQKHWEESSSTVSSMVRIAVDATSVYLVRPLTTPAGLCEVDRFDRSALDSPPQVLATLTPPPGNAGPDNYVCTPVGIALDGGQLFVATHNRSGPAYFIATYQPGMQSGFSNDVTGTVWSVPTVGGAPATVASGRVFAAFYVQNVLVAQQGQLYWAEGTAPQGQGWSTSAIAQSAEAAGSTPKEIGSISNGYLPTGLAASSAGVFWTTSLGNVPQGGSRQALGGCVVRTLTSSGAADLYSDLANACSDLAADADSVYFPTVVPEVSSSSSGPSSGSGYARTHAIARVRVADRTLVGPIVVQAENVDLTRLQMQSASSLLAIDPNVILAVPTSLLQ